MKSLLSMVSLILSGSAAIAVDYRWTVNYDQGTVEAIIRNRNDANISIYCPEGQTDTTPGMFFEVASIKPQRASG